MLQSSYICKKYEGSEYVLVDAYFWGPVIKEFPSRGPCRFYYLCVLFAPRPPFKPYMREITLATRDHGNELHRFHRAVYVDDAPDKIDYEDFSSCVINDIRNNTINVRVQWYNRPWAIQTIKIIDPPTIIKTPEMLWDSYHINRHPDLINNNKYLLSTFDGVPNCVSQNDSINFLKERLGDIVVFNKYTDIPHDYFPIFKYEKIAKEFESGKSHFIMAYNTLNVCAHISFLRDLLNSEDVKLYTEKWKNDGLSDILNKV